MALTAGQLRCVETLDAPIAVSAGAGSGKTFTLTRRIVHALESGFIDDVGEVLAITFTSKAAGEIKSRVKGALRQAGMAEQALKVDDAWISTIHGMCARILRAHALELGIDPQFAVADEASAQTLLDAALEEVIGGRDDLVTVARGIDQDSLDALFAEFDAHAAGPQSASVAGMVRELVGAASAHPDGMDSVVLPPEAEPARALLSQLVEEAQTAAILAQGVKPGSSRDGFLMATQEAIEGAQRLIEGSGDVSYEAALAAMNAFPVPGRRFGKNTPYGEQAPELAERYLACAAQARAGLMRGHLSTLVGVARLVGESFARRKRQAGLLDNDDLLTFAARAFSEHPDIEAAYAGRFKLVMIDEFQDTDQLQVDMVKRMAGEGFSRLCTVGDAQQSIYRFRGADVSVYRRHLQAVLERNPQGVIELPDNFRSHRDVLALCDRVFEQPQVFGAGFMSLAPGRSEEKVKRPFLPKGPRVAVQVTLAPSRGVSSADAVAVSARRVASRFAELVRAGHKPGDMVVLLGGMTRAGVYAGALREAGLPCVVAGGSIFNSAPEVALMVRLAQAIANPQWTAATFEVLSSELFALSADDLLELGTGMDDDRGIPRRRALDQGLRSVQKKVRQGVGTSAALTACVNLMGRAADEVGNLALSDIMEGVVADSGWLARLEAQGPEGLARAGNVYKAIRMARDIEAAGCIGPATVAGELARRVALAKEAPGALSAEGGDFVRIMTVHASKGLEFPIVAVAEMRDDALRASALASTTVQGRAYVSLDGGRTLERLAGKSSSLLSKSKSYQPFSEFDEDELSEMAPRAATPADRRAAILRREQLGQAAEARRLLYVALTRAKEALVLCMRGKATSTDPSGLSKGCWADVQSALAGVGGAFEAGTSMFDFGGERPAEVECLRLDAGNVDELLGRAGAQAAGSGGSAQAGDACGGEGGAGSVGEGCDVAGEPGAVLHGGAPREDAAGGEPKLIDIPVVEPYAPSRGKPFAPTRAGVFSYSSVSGNGFSLDEELYECEVDAAAPADGEAVDAVGSAQAGKACAGEGGTGAVAVADADADATELGTAFHRLVQLSVLSRRPGEALARPVEARQKALERSCSLSALQRDRLDAALGRWFASEVAKRAAACARVSAEVPFMVRMESDAPAFLEGEMDLLACEGEPGSSSAPAGRALVIDYKTGGSCAEGAEALREKHLLQASCYAYAMLRQGYAQVECVFVRVEQGRADNAGQPQTVSYRFDAACADAVGRAIVQAYHAGSAKHETERTLA